ncbi:hypothetical protein BRADI_3g28065v3 [Brachypodium distachyon]|uniref:Uncharacterized protein n=1 Tax=Brachypodium distachyon TaxID=15368 RepID=A0A2K2CZP1_BRADI|nr:hypothetical protein BRADI_3g28065v3 [Brachypodium distachyon]
MRGMEATRKIGQQMQGKRIEGIGGRDDVRNKHGWLQDRGLMGTRWHIRRNFVKVTWCDRTITTNSNLIYWYR